VYVMPTVLIKALMAMVVWKLWREKSWMWAAIAFVMAEAVMVLGYFCLEAVLYGVAAAAASVLPNCVQGIMGIGLGLVCHGLYPRLALLVKRF